MANNNMRVVAHLLGVELEEEFKLKGQGRCSYKFTSEGLFCEYDDDGWFLTGITVFKLLNGEYEIEKPILDRKEKEYLSNVIKPFRNEVCYIEKHRNPFGNEWITIHIKSGINMYFPAFKGGTMYKGMEIETKYYLKDLGL